MECIKCCLKKSSLFCCSVFAVFFTVSVIALFFTSLSTTTSASLEIKSEMKGKSEIHYQESIISLSTRRQLSVPGSWPPRCTSKCGNCRPCKPVHVPVPPGTPVTAEYYPEAWRCKCGNRLYMP